MCQSSSLFHALVGVQCAHFCKKSSPYWFDVLEFGAFEQSQEFIGLCSLSATFKTPAAVGTYGNANVFIGEDESGI